MAATTLTVQNTGRAGVEVTMSAPDVTDGVEFLNTNQKPILLVENGSGASIDVTLQITATLDGLALPDRTVAVAAGALKAIGPFPDLYEQSDGYIRATFSSITSVTAGVIAPGSNVVA